MIEFQKITKKFGNTLALQNINLKISPKEFVFIVGPSGSGKTTLLKLLLREIKPTEGRIFVDGKDLAKIKDIHHHRQKIGAVFQDFKLLFDKTLEENISLVLEIQKIPDKKIHEAVDHVLELVGLEDKKPSFPLQLSGGELQRAVISRAMVANPQIIFADEPTGNLDLESAWQIVKILKDQQKLGKTVIMATHNVEIVKTLNDRVVALKKGKILSDEKKEANDGKN